MDEVRTVLVLRARAIGWDELVAALSDLPGVALVGVTEDLAEARRIAAAEQPDALIAPAGASAERALQLLVDLRRASCPALKGILFAGAYTVGRPALALEAGIVAYLLWPDLTPETLRYCLLAAITGDVVLGSGGVVRPFVAALRGGTEQRLARAQCSERERAILGRMADGMSRAEIAQAEGISVTTVKRTVADLASRFDAPNAFVLAVRATQLGLIR